VTGILQLLLPLYRPRRAIHPTQAVAPAAAKGLDFVTLGWHIINRDGDDPNGYDKAELDALGREWLQKLGDELEREIKALPDSHRRFYSLTATGQPRENKSNL